MSEPRVLAEAAGCKSYFALTLISQNRHFHMWRDMLMKYSSVKYSEFILAFQVQFGTYEAESEHFRWGKEKAPFPRVVFKKVDLLHFGYLADLRFLKPVFKGILNTSCVFKAATYVKQEAIRHQIHLEIEKMIFG